MMNVIVASLRQLTRGLSRILETAQLFASMVKLCLRRKSTSIVQFGDYLRSLQIPLAISIQPTDKMYVFSTPLVPGTSRSNLLRPTVSSVSPIKEPDGVKLES